MVLFGSAKIMKQAMRFLPLLIPSSRHGVGTWRETQLDQAVILIAACKAIVTNDSGLMHVAAALNRPLVALYGPE